MEEAERIAVSEDAERAKEAAAKAGYEAGYARVVARAENIPRLFEKAFEAFLAGRLSIEGRDQPVIVATRPDAEDLARGARILGFGKMIVRFTDIMETLGPYREAAMGEVKAMCSH